MTDVDPSITLVIPVYNGESHIGKCLERVALSTAQPDEIIVVDDCSSDRSAAIAEAAGARVLRTPERSGPARARNLAAAEARAEIIFFIDSDVLVSADTIARVGGAFARDAELDALIGSYDDSPDSPDFLSQYKNLMHHFVHQHGHREACTFWSGCGAIRREVFQQHGGFDESYQRPAVEDIELGYRLTMAACKVMLDPEIQVKHLKHWTFWGLLKTDIFDRGIPWTELILRDRHMPNDLNVQLSQRVSVALSFVLCALALAAAIYWGGLFLTPLFVLLFLVLGRYWGEAVSQKDSKKGVVWTSVVVAAIVAMSAANHMYGLIPPLVLGYGLLLVHHRYEYQDEHRRRYVRAAALTLSAVVAGLAVFYLPTHPLIFAIMAVLLVVTVLNTQFFLFLAAKKNRLFALAAAPFYLLYHLYSGISFIAGMARFVFMRSAGKTSPNKINANKISEGAASSK